MAELLKLRPERRPNVIWIFGDQHRAQALGYRGDINLHTPNIDNLAREGVRFDCAEAVERSSESAGSRVRRETSLLRCVLATRAIHRSISRSPPSSTKCSRSAVSS